MTRSHSNPCLILRSTIGIALIILVLSQLTFISNMGKSSYFDYDYNYLIGALDENIHEDESVSITNAFVEQFVPSEIFNERRFVNTDKYYLNTTSPKREQTLETGMRPNSNIKKNASHTTITDVKKVPAKVEFAMCAIIKDENNNLLEWTAYHYTMINLRHLIFCNDVDSVSSPLHILDRWKDLIQIDVWEVNEFSPPKTVGNETMYDHYKKRQRRCFAKCMNHFMSYNRTWALFIDPDEFLTFNPVADDDDKCIFDKKGDSFSVSYPKNCNETENPNLIKRGDGERTTIALWKKRVKLPTNLASKTIAEYMQEHPHIWSRFNCHIFPRLQFGSEQESNKTILNKHMPSNIYAQNFTTLSFFSHGKKGNFRTNKWAKCIIDVSRLHNNVTKYDVRSPHYLTKNCGGEKKGDTPHDRALFRVNHYVGNMESFLSKNDFHRDEDMFNKKAIYNNYTSYQMQGWLLPFVKSVGRERAVMLLEGIGEIKDYKVPNAIIRDCHKKVKGSNCTNAVNVETKS